MNWPLPVPALPELQRAFLHGLLAERADDAGAAAPRGFDVYRRNCLGNFRDALASAFPLLAALLGEGPFARLARDYQRVHPSRAGNLYATGQELPRFLRNDSRRPPVLAEVAGLEWVIQECLVAADEDMLFDEVALARLPSEEYGNLLFQLHPAARPCTTEWPLMDWWRRLQEAVPPDPRDLAEAEPAREHLLVRRGAGGIELHRLSAPDHALLAAFRRGEPLDAALDSALVLDAEYDIAARLRTWVGERILRPLP